MFEHQEDDYKDIIGLPHHVSKNRARMTMEERAAQFSPFAALTGYDDVIYEVGRETEETFSHGDEQEEILNMKLRFLKSTISVHPPVTVTYFVPDKLKSGGKYESFFGCLRDINETERQLIFTSGEKIPLDLISDIPCDLF